MTDDQNNQNSNDDETTYTPSDDDAKHQQSKPPSVKGEEDVFSGDMPAEPADIDEEIKKATGEELDPEHPKPLGED